MIVMIMTMMNDDDDDNDKYDDDKQTRFPSPGCINFRLSPTISQVDEDGAGRPAR